MRIACSALVVALMGVLGCHNTPKREMREDKDEVLTTPPPGAYTNPPDLPRDQPLLMPKSPTPGLNNSPSINNPGMGGMNTPGLRGR